MFDRFADWLQAENARNQASTAPIVCGIRDSKGDDPVELLIYGVVGDSYEAMDARSVVGFLRSNRKRDVLVRINSGGGSAFDGIAIYNALRDHEGNTTSVIEGIAGSAASVIAIGAKTVRIHENAVFFIHRTSVGVFGNVDLLAEASDWLNKLDDALVNMYRAKTKRTGDKIKNWLRGRGDGTMFSAEEALAERFVDEVIPVRGTLPAKAEMEKLPESYRDTATKRLAPAGFMSSQRRHERKGHGIAPA